MNRHKSRKVFLTGCRIIQTFAPLRHRGKIVYLLFAVFLLGPAVHAKKKPDDWRAVENLAPGTHVIVKAHRRYSCTVEGATEEQLFCWVHERRSFHLVSIAIARAEIREVRSLPNQAKDAWIGAGIGAGAGAIAAGTTSRDYPAFHAFVGGVAGAAGGALVGATVPIFQYLIKHGKCIYKS